MNQVIIPNDIDFCVDELFHGTIVATFHEVFASDFAPLGQYVMMRELEKWQSVGVFSLAPIIIETDLTQEECIETFKTALQDYNWHDIIVTILAHKYQTTKARVDEVLVSGPTVILPSHLRE